MVLRIGIIGLPNVGKSTTFNALTKTQNAEVANYPFCTIEPNKAVVPVPDPRLNRLAELVGVEKVIPATIEFMDIAGLVKGASRGEGLGNQFLAQIRNTDALLHIVRCFDDANIVHVNPEPDPQQDIETIEIELALADLEQIDKKISKLERQVKGDPKIRGALEMAVEVKHHLENLSPLSTFKSTADPRFQELNQELQFLTHKPIIYGANLNEDQLSGGNPYLETVQSIARDHKAPVIKFSARMEQDLIDFTDQEIKEYLQLADIPSSGLEQIIQTSYALLNLISFFTYNKDEVRAWTVEKGTRAPQAAGKIHTDFEKGFIKAEVVPYETFHRLGSMTAVKQAGKLRLEGKDYVVQNGDVIYFRFNV